jgi:tetratricopeptide (TPR) repeat protein
MRKEPNRSQNKINALIERYEKMIEGEFQSFFDSYEFEDIVEHYIDNGQLGEAMTSMDIASEQYPYSAIFLIKKAQILTILERLNEAENSLELAQILDPSNVDLYIAKGSILSKRKKHHKALKLFQKAQDLSDEPIEVFPFVAFEYQCLGQFQEAIKYLSEFLFSDPEDDIALFNIAYCYERLDAYKDAIDFFSNLINEAPYNEINWYQLGLFYNKAKDYKNAVWALDYAILIDECFTAGYHEKARSLTQLGKSKEAIKTYILTFPFEEPTGYTYLKIGLCYKDISSFKQAIRYFTKSCHQDPQLSEAWMEMGLCYDALDSTEEALHHINKALILSPNDLEYLYIQTGIFRKVGLYAEADLGYQKLIELGCDAPAIWIEYANLTFSLNELKDSINLLKQGLKHNNNHIDLLLNLCAYSFLSGKLSQAKKYLVKAISIDSDAIELLYEQFPQLEKNNDFNQI